MSNTSPKSNFLGIIEEDATIALDRLQNDDSSYNRRIFIKNFYSFLEGLLHCLRQDVVEKKILTTAEKAVLSEESYLVSNFQIKTKQNAFLTFEQSFRLSLRYYFGETYDSTGVDYGDGGWKDLIDGLKIRNRITHPKFTDQLEITDKELETVKRAKVWTDEVIKGLFERRHQDRVSLHEEIQSKIAELEKRTRIRGIENMTINKKCELIIGSIVKHNIVYLVGFIGEENGVENQFKRFWVYEGKKCLMIDDSDQFFDDVVFPIRFSPDYPEIDLM